MAHAHEDRACRAEVTFVQSLIKFKKLSVKRNAAYPSQSDKLLRELSKSRGLVEVEQLPDGMKRGRQYLIELRWGLRLLTQFFGPVSKMGGHPLDAHASPLSARSCVEHNARFRQAVILDQNRVAALSLDSGRANEPQSVGRFIQNPGPIR